MKKLLAGLTNAAVGVVATLIFFFSLEVNAQNARGVSPSATPRTSTWSCELSAFFAGSKASASDLKGSGMLTCKNARGFSVEQAVDGTIRISGDVDSINDRLEPIRVTLESQTFALIRDLNQVYAAFEPETDSSRILSETSNEIMLVSHDRKIVIPMNVSLPQSSLGKWQIENVTLVARRE